MRCPKCNGSFKHVGAHLRFCSAPPKTAPTEHLTLKDGAVPQYYIEGVSEDWTSFVAFTGLYTLGLGFPDHDYLGFAVDGSDFMVIRNPQSDAAVYVNDICVPDKFTLTARDTPYTIRWNTAFVYVMLNSATPPSANSK